jgi:hypothetical protein
MGDHLRGGCVDVSQRLIRAANRFELEGGHTGQTINCAPAAKIIR